MTPSLADDVILRFPQGFLWGTATASYQVEGGNENCDWWAWEQTPGHIQDGSRCGLASDWWRRAEQDLALAADWGQNTHRLSLEWSRLEPSEGAWNEAAVSRYREILGFMRARGIEPMITLHHFTLPLWVSRQGGWENARTVACFVRFVERAVDAFGDLCHLWCTINEPLAQIAMGYVFRLWPPGRGDVMAMRAVLRHLSHAHSLAYERLHAHQSDAQVGYAKHVRVFDPADPASRIERWLAKLADGLFNELGLRAFATGAPPMLWSLGRATPVPSCLDFVGLNYYARERLAFDPRRKGIVHRLEQPDLPAAAEGWGELYPEGLYRSLVRVSAYELPIYLTEFGVPDNDDHLRPRFIVEHVAALHRAIAAGVPVRGAYFWSLVDNFEWAAGWAARFGLLALDPATQVRTPRPSAAVYAAIARANGLPRALVAEYAPELVAPLFS